MRTWSLDVILPSFQTQNRNSGGRRGNTEAIELWLSSQRIYDGHGACVSDKKAPLNLGPVPKLVSNSASVPQRGTTDRVTLSTNFMEENTWSGSGETRPVPMEGLHGV